MIERSWGGARPTGTAVSRRGRVEISSCADRAAPNEARPRALFRCGLVAENAMMRRGTRIGACALCLVAYASAVDSKPRRPWVDPPHDLPIAAVPPSAPAPEPAHDPDLEDVPSVAAWPPADPAGADAAQLVRSAPG